MKKLENFKAFPYVAWTVIILFAIFTFHLVFALQKNLKSLDTVSSESTYISSNPQVNIQ